MLVINYITKSHSHPVNILFYKNSNPSGLYTDLYTKFKEYQFKNIIITSDNFQRSINYNILRHLKTLAISHYILNHENHKSDRAQRKKKSKNLPPAVLY